MSSNYFGNPLFSSTDSGWYHLNTKWPAITRWQQLRCECSENWDLAGFSYGDVSADTGVCSRFLNCWISRKKLFLIAVAVVPSSSAISCQS